MFNDERRKEIKRNFIDLIWSIMTMALATVIAIVSILIGELCVDCGCLISNIVGSIMLGIFLTSIAIAWFITSNIRKLMEKEN